MASLKEQLKRVQLLRETEECWHFLHEMIRLIRKEGGKKISSENVVLPKISDDAMKIVEATVIQYVRKLSQMRKQIEESDG